MTETKWILYSLAQNRKFHKLLEDQLSQTKNRDKEIDIEKLCSLVSQSYRNFEEEILLCNGSYEKATQELFEANAIIQQQSAPSEKLKK